MDRPATTHARMTLDPRSPNALGRAAECRLQILNRAISKVHAVVAWDADIGRWRLKSEGKNGTTINGEPAKVGSWVDLDDGDELELAGMYALSFRSRAGRDAWLEPDASAAGDSTAAFRYVPAVMRLGLGTDRAEVLEIDTDSRTALLELPGKPGPTRQRLVLQRAEFEVLRLLALNAGRAVSRGDLQEVTSEKDLAERLSDSVYRHISQLKRKLGPFAACLKPVHGVGYVLDGVRAL